MLVDGPKETWKLGTSDTGAYATLSEVFAYFEWLDECFTNSNNKR